jgi:xanthine phosphoribosyltransferase
MKKEQYTYKQLTKDMPKLIKKIDFKPDAILAIARGGLTIAHILSESMNNKNLFVLNAMAYEGVKRKGDVKVFNIPNLQEYNNILIVDEIIDSGDSMAAILDIMNKNYPNHCFKIATLFYKPTALIQPHFTIHEAKNWIEFFWTKDF